MSRVVGMCFLWQKVGEEVRISLVGWEKIIRSRTNKKKGGGGVALCNKIAVLKATEDSLFLNL